MKQFGLICVLALFGLTVPGSATLLTLPYTVGLLPTPPASLLAGQLASSYYIFMFLEQQHVLLTSPLNVDITAPGTYTLRTQLAPGQLPAGTVVNSYYFHTNPINSKMQWLSQAIGFSTDENVVGIMVGSPTLAGGVPIVGMPRTVYNGPAAQNGLKLATAGKDTIQISTDLHTVTVSEQLKQGAVTEFRIITVTVPVTTP